MLRALGDERPRWRKATRPDAAQHSTIANIHCAELVGEAYDMGYQLGRMLRGESSRASVAAFNERLDEALAQRLPAWLQRSAQKRLSEEGLRATMWRRKAYPREIAEGFADGSGILQKDVERAQLSSELWQLIGHAHASPLPFAMLASWASESALFAIARHRFDGTLPGACLVHFNPSEGLRHSVYYAGHAPLQAQVVVSEAGLVFAAEHLPGKRRDLLGRAISDELMEAARRCQSMTEALQYLRRMRPISAVGIVILSSTESSAALIEYREERWIQVFGTERAIYTGAGREVDGPFSRKALALRDIADARLAEVQSVWDVPNIARLAQELLPSSGPALVVAPQAGYLYAEGVALPLQYQHSVTRSQPKLVSVRNPADACRARLVQALLNGAELPELLAASEALRSLDANPAVLLRHARILLKAGQGRAALDILDEAKAASDDWLLWRARALDCSGRRYLAQRAYRDLLDSSVAEAAKQGLQQRYRYSDAARMQLGPMDAWDLF